MVPQASSRELGGLSLNPYSNTPTRPCNVCVDHDVDLVCDQMLRFDVVEHSMISDRSVMSIVSNVM